MKIYVAHSNKSNFKTELYEPLKSISATDPKIQFIFPHEENSNPLSPKKLFHNKSCELVIAEVSLPSIDLGIELGWADRYNIPVICIHQKGTEISSSLNIVSSHFLEYNDAQDLVIKLKNALLEYQEDFTKNE